MLASFDFFLLCFFLFFLLWHPLEGLSASPNDTESGNGFLGVNTNNQLVFAPPQGGEVVIQNFTRLDSVEHALKETTTNLSLAMGRLAQAESTLSATQSALVVAQAGLSQANEALASNFDVLLSDLLFVAVNPSLTKLFLKYWFIKGDLTVSSNKVLGSVAFPFLETLGGSLTITMNALLSSISLPKLSFVGGAIRITGNGPTVAVGLLALNLTALPSPGNSLTIYAPNLTCNALAPTNCASQNIGIFGGQTLGNGTMYYSFTRSQQFSGSIIPIMNVIRKESPTAGYCPSVDSVFIAGGASDDYGLTTLASVAKLDPKALTWSTVNSLAQKRSYTASACTDSYWYVCGGFTGSARLNSCEKLQLSTLTWSSAKNLNTVRAALAMVSYNGMVLAMGGDDGSTVFNSAEIYNPASDSWSSFVSLNKPRSSFGATVVLGKVYVAGGSENTLEVYNESSSAWTLLSSKIPTGARSLHAVVSHKNRVVILGGSNVQIDVYDPAADQWTTLPPLLTQYTNIAAASF